jgi:3-hydroxyacyl-[acyl-carrier-protein] dehydratase
MRYYLIDRIEEIKYGDYLKAVKCITLSDDVFNEHFPGYPIYPGCLILEGLAQAAGALFELTMIHNKVEVRRSVLSIINRMKFRGPVFPGDRIIITTKIISSREDSGVASVEAEVDGKVCADGEITFTFHDISNEILEVNRKNLYDNCMRSVKVIQ